MRKILPKKKDCVFVAVINTVLLLLSDFTMMNTPQPTVSSWEMLLSVNCDLLWKFKFMLQTSQCCCLVTRTQTWYFVSLTRVFSCFFISCWLHSEGPTLQVKHPTFLSNGGSVWLCYRCITAGQDSCQGHTNRYFHKNHVCTQFSLVWGKISLLSTYLEYLCGCLLYDPHTHTYSRRQRHRICWGQGYSDNCRIK